MVEHLRISFCFRLGYLTNLQFERNVAQIIARTPLLMHQNTLRLKYIFNYNDKFLDLFAQKIILDLSLSNDLLYICTNFHENI